uniref:Uncharacterized protein n=1 Tax=Caenorhabditis japonica TaxID=281687 RepID=A0A8R1HZV9_CAEJA
MSAPKLVRVAQTAVFNQFMTREAVSTASIRQFETNKTLEQPTHNIRIHDESTHLKFGFPKTEKIGNTVTNDDYLQMNAEKLVKEEKERQFQFLKLTSLSL